MCQKAFCTGVVEAISPSWHTLNYTTRFKLILIPAVPVLPALVRMENRRALLVQFCKRLVQHLINHSHCWTLWDTVGNHFVIKEIDNRGEVELSPIDGKFGDVSDPFSLGRVALKFRFRTLSAVSPSAPRHELYRLTLIAAFRESRFISRWTTLWLMRPASCRSASVTLR